MSILEVSGINKHFGQTEVLKGIDFTLEKGQALAIIGPSGSGKTTLLRCLTYLETPDSGKISVNGEVIFDADDPSQLSEEKKRLNRLHFGLVFQSFNLFPQYTTLQNVTLAGELLAKERPNYKQNKKDIIRDIRSNAEEILASVGLSDRLNSYPHQLSGGQQQRVGLARALAVDPKIMLMDEPFGAVDSITREMLQDELMRLHQETGKTFLLVTHDIEEAFKLGERVIIMNEGTIRQFDTPDVIIRRPADPFVQSLVNSAKAKEAFWREYL